MLEAGSDAGRDDPGGEASRRGAGDLARKEQLDLTGSPEVEILANDRLEELAASQRTGEDLGHTDFHLEDRQLIGEPGGAMGGRQGQGELGLPPGEDGLDLGRRKRVARLLHRCRIGTPQEAIVQGGETAALPGELALGPLMPVEPDLDGVGGVATDLDKGGAPLRVQEINVVVIDVDRFAKEREVAEPPGLLLRGSPGRRPVLGHANEDAAGPAGPFRAVGFDDLSLCVARCGMRSTGCRARSPTRATGS